MSIFKPKLFEDFEIRGQWWLPGRDENKVSGILEYGSNRIALSLLGSFFESDVKPFHGLQGERRNPAVVNGLSHDGELITLLNCLEVGSGWSTAGGTGTIQYSPTYLLRGDHFGSFPEMLFESCFVSYTLLEEWVGKRAFDVEFVTEEERIIGQTAHYRNDDSFDIYLPSIESKLLLKHRVANRGGDWFRTLGWEHAAWVKFAPDDRRDFYWYRSNLYRFRNLLTFFTGVPIRINAIELYQELPKANEDYKPVVYLYFGQNQPAKKGNIHPYDFVVRLSNVKANLSEIINLWFRKSDELDTFYEIFLSTLYADNLYQHLHFLSLTQALETFHRKTRAGTYLLEADYEEIRKSVVAAIPSTTESDLKDSLKSRLKYGNEYSQRKRFSNMLAELSEGCVRLITDEPRDFINKVVDTRNYLTHYSDELKDAALEGADLYNVNIRLRTFLTILLLKEIGLPELQISKLVERNPRLTKDWVHDAEFTEP